jgi:hypothetical protein
MIRYFVLSAALCAASPVLAGDPWLDSGRRTYGVEDMQRDLAAQSQARDASSALLKQDLQTMTQSNDSLGMQREIESLNYRNGRY